ncbi:hypothetical protein [Roseomonas indoligenes]|uniref:Uncharacterized protein n=1 Tax=Roseomonas indoligenes TaxID=2820811 RepID=A0A940MZE8_9PROT|nr:hypothetical protein [Pararoseomonas indoligenes]MBP0493982.1 hypothetical protein [Pararoseomonas indoligenes]
MYEGSSLINDMGHSEPAEMVIGCGPLNGPSYRYRNATIDGNLPGTLFRITMAGHVIDGWSGMCRLQDAVGLVDAAHSRLERAMQLLSPVLPGQETLGQRVQRSLSVYRSGPDRSN